MIKGSENVSQSQKMRTALKKLVIPNLLEKGFVGEYPHYKKTYDDRIELLSFDTNKWGNSFTVEISTVFLPSSKRDNNFSDSKNKDYNNATVWDTNYRYRLRGMFDGWFSYDDEFYDKVCDEVNKQMEDAYKWWDLFYKNKRFKIKLMEFIDEKGLIK